MRFQYAIRRNDPVQEQRDRELEDYLASGEPGPWVQPTLLNGWSNTGSGFLVAEYRKVGDDVEVHGVVGGGTLGLDLWSMPEGFRPVDDFDAPAVLSSGGSVYVASIRVGGGGGFSPTAGGNTQISFNFRYATT